MVWIANHFRWLCKPNPNNVLLKGEKRSMRILKGWWWMDGRWMKMRSCNPPPPHPWRASRMRQLVHYTYPLRVFWFKNNNSRVEWPLATCSTLVWFSKSCRYWFSFSLFFFNLSIKKNQTNIKNVPSKSKKPWSHRGGIFDVSISDAYQLWSEFTRIFFHFYHRLNIRRQGGHLRTSAPVLELIGWMGKCDLSY